MPAHRDRAVRGAPRIGLGCISVFRETEMSDEAPKVVVARKALEDAKKARREVEDLRDEAIEQTRARFREELGNVIRDENKAYYLLQQAIVDEAIRQNVDMYSGVLVEWSRFWSDKIYKPTGRRGRYEIMTPTTQVLPPKPYVGGKFVRLLKKDGTPGLRRGDYWDSGKWLPEGETP
jgi:hypothetical protein